MSSDSLPIARTAELARFRNYLLLVARLQLPARLREKLDPSDAVQQTLLRVIEKIDQFLGSTDEELAGWLRQVLTSTLANLARDWQREKRDVGREVSFAADVDQSSA